MFDRDYRFRGKHSEYAKALVQEHKIFKRIIDVYILAPLVGLYYNQRASEDSGSSTTNILAEVMIKEQPKLKYVYRLIILLDRSEDLSEEKRIERAFRGSKGDHDKGMEIFNSYALGGVEKLHERIVEGVEKIEEDDFVDSLDEFLTSFKDSLDIEKILSLPALLEKYK